MNRIKLFPLLFSLFFVASIVSLVNAQVEITVNPTSLPAINEGEKTTFSVIVTNVGTEGTVSISVGSDYYSFTPLTPTFRNMKEGETYTFKFEAYALNVNEDTDTTITVFVQGRGGSDTVTITGKILNVEGYTPELPPYKEKPSYPSELFYMVAGIVIGAVVVGTFFVVKRRKEKLNPSKR